MSGVGFVAEAREGLDLGERFFADFCPGFGIGISIRLIAAWCRTTEAPSRRTSRRGAIPGCSSPGIGATTAPITKECQSFLDNLVAQFGRARSQNDQPRGVGTCDDNLWLPIIVTIACSRAATVSRDGRAPESLGCGGWSVDHRLRRRLRGLLAMDRSGLDPYLLVEFEFGDCLASEFIQHFLARGMPDIMSG